MDHTHEVGGSIPSAPIRLSVIAETSYVYLATFASAVEILEFCKMVCTTICKPLCMETSHMPRPRNPLPASRHHKQTGRAAVSIYRTNGSRTEVILPGDYGSEQSKQEFERLLCQLRANGGKLPTGAATKDISIAELVLKFMEHA